MENSNTAVKNGTAENTSPVADILGSWGEQEKVSAGFVEKPKEEGVKVVIEIDTKVPPVKLYQKFENGRSEKCDPSDPDARVRMQFETTDGKKCDLPPKAFNQVVQELKDAGWNAETLGVFKVTLRTEGTNTGKTAWTCIAAKRSDEGPF